MFEGPLKAKSEAEKCAYLMIWLGNKGREVYGTWTLTDDEQKSLETLFKKFEDYVKPKSNKVFNRYKFLCKKQGDVEACEQFITELKVLVKDCGYADADEMVRDKIVFGTKHPKVREKLIGQGSDLTLEKAVDIARTYEIEQKHLKTMNTGEDPNVNIIKRKGPNIKHQNSQLNSRPRVINTHDKQKYERQGARPKTVRVCQRCGGKCTNKQKCPAIGKVCNKCNKPNHFAVMCRASISFKRNKQINEIDTDSDIDFDELYVGTLNMNNNDSDSFIEYLNIGNQNVCFQLDTGAKCNVLAKSDFEKLKIKYPLKKAESRLKSFSGHTINSDGIISLPVTVKDTPVDMEFYVVDTKSLSVIGAETCEKVGLIKRIYGIESNYSDLYQGLGCLPGTHSIKIDKSVTPKVHPPRKVPIALKQRVKQELKRMEKLGVITRQKEPTPWVNSMVTVVKPNGDIRICIDPRDLNNAIQREHYPMKTIEEVLAEMPNAKVFTKLDATSGFWQLKLTEESSKLTTFNTPFGRYRFRRAPFGIKSIPEIYQKCMVEMLEDIPGVEVIVDDILVWGSTIQEHDERLKMTLDRIRENNVKLSENKCQYRKDEIDYVGHTVCQQGLKASEEKIRATRDMKQPQSKKELQTFFRIYHIFAKVLATYVRNKCAFETIVRK